LSTSRYQIAEGHPKPVRKIKPVALTAGSRRYQHTADLHLLLLASPFYWSDL
jgi:hypothetical protein